MHKVRYRVGDDFGVVIKGTIIDAFVIFQDGPIALVYVPKDEKELVSCSCLFVCKYDRRCKEETWGDTGDNSWLHIDRRDKESRSFDNMIIKMISEIKE